MKKSIGIAKLLLIVITFVVLAAALIACNPTDPADNSDHTEPTPTPTDISYFRFRANEDITGFIARAQKDITLPADIVIPNEYNGLPVVGIDQSAFAYRTEIETVTVLSNMQFIEDSAFEGCSSLRNVDLERSNITDIKQRAFYQCTNLNEIIFSKSLETIGDAAFISCISLKEINMPDTVRTIMYKAFSNCKSLENLNLSNSLESIEAGAFMACTSLREVYLPQNIESIYTIKDILIGILEEYYNYNNNYDFKFSNLCPMLPSPKDIDYFKGIKCEIFDESGLLDLNDFDLPGVFEDCTSLETITISSKTYVTPGICRGCVNLKSICYY